MAETRRRVVTDVAVDQFSGRYDKAPRVLARQVRRSARSRSRGIILLTEVASDARADAARMAGWTLSRDTSGDMGEVGILTRDALWEVLRFRAYVLERDLGPGGRVVAGLALLRHRLTGATLVVSVAHLPASVEGHWQGSRAVAHRAAVNRWRRIHLAWRRAFAPDAEMAWADWNLNLLRKWVREWITTAWPALHLPSAARIVSKGGTHRGGRLIDWFVFRGMAITSWRILRWPWASDHFGNRVHARIVTRA